MAELQAIKRRLRSVGNTRQITRAMQMVAASKLRRAQAGAEAPKLYTAALQGVLDRLGHGPELSRHPLYVARSVQRQLVIVVSADRGLAGAYNGNLFRELGRLTSQTIDETMAITIGRRGALHLSNAVGINEIAAYEMDNLDPDTGLAQPILSEVRELFTAGDIDVVYLLSTRFHSSVKQVVESRQLLPITPASQEIATTELEPGYEAVVTTTVDRWLEGQVYQAIVEARASEQAARMVAMMNATDNASDLIDDLTLARNNARQAAITQELAEISSGAEAVTNA